MEASARHPQHFRAVAMLLLANVYWGLSFPTIKALALVHDQVAPGGDGEFVTAMLVAPRFVVAALVMLVWQASRLGLTTRNELRQGVELGLFTSLGVYFQNAGLQATSASTSAFLTQLYAVLIPLWVALRLRRGPGSQVWAACALVLAGVAILGRFDWRTLTLGRGEWQTLIGSVFFAGQILCLGRKEHEGNDPLRVTTVMFAVQAVLFSVMAAFVVQDWESVGRLCASPSWVRLTLVLALVCSLGAINLMNRWQPKITPVEAGLIYCFEPIFGAIFALFTPKLYSQLCGIEYANEKATWSLLAGGGLITLANVLLTVWPAKRQDSPVSGGGL